MARAWQRCADKHGGSIPSKGYIDSGANLPPNGPRINLPLACILKNLVGKLRREVSKVVFMRDDGRKG